MKSSCYQPYAGAAAGMALAAIINIGSLLLSVSPAHAGQAEQADKLVDSIGVCVHLWYPNTPYTSNYSTVKAKLLAANIRHVRDDFAVDQPAGATAWKDLAASGIKTGYIFNQQWATVDTFKSFLLSNDLLKTVDYFEGPNEFDGSRPDWVTVLKSYQMDLFNKMKADPQTAPYPVLAPAFIINRAADRTAMGDISAWVDYGNCHPYPGGQMPSTSQTVNEIASCSINSGTKPIFISEIGYHNALNTTSTHPPASEAATALYLPRVYFDTYSRGIRRTYNYEFVDHLSDGGAKTNAEAYFGLVRNDLTEKPAYLALKNLTTIMKDPGSAFTPGSLTYTLSGATVKSVLFQKRDGTFYLALWREVSVWNTSTRTDIVPAAQDVTITFPSMYNVESYNPTASATAEQTWTGVTNATVSLQGEVKILKISNRFRLINRWTGLPMHIENLNGFVQYGAIAAGAWSSHWMLAKNSEGYYTIRSRWTGDYVHIENLRDYAQYGANMSSFWSAQWTLSKNSEGYYTIVNRWIAVKLHTENLQGWVQYGAIYDSSWSAQWNLTAAP